MDAQYAAGLLDGEGTVAVRARIEYRVGKPNRRYALVLVEIANTYLPVLEELREQWGGKVYVRPIRNGSTRPIGVWRVMHSKAAAFLMDVAPHSRVKREQIANALAFQAAREAKGRRHLTEADTERITTFLSRSRALNNPPMDG